MVILTRGVCVRVSVTLRSCITLLSSHSWCPLETVLVQKATRHQPNPPSLTSALSILTQLSKLHRFQLRSTWLCDALMCLPCYTSENHVLCCMTRW